MPSSIPHAPWFQLTRLLRPFHAQMAIRSKGPLSGATDIQGFWKVPEVQVNQRLSADVILHPVVTQDRGQCCAAFPLDGRGLLQRPARLWVLEIVGLLRHANDCTHSDHRGCAWFPALLASVRLLILHQKRQGWSILCRHNQLFLGGPQVSRWHPGPCSCTCGHPCG